MLSATASSGAAVSESYLTRPVHIASMMLPPPTSFVVVGIRGFCGSVLLTDTVPVGPSALPPADPPSPPLPLSSPPQAPNNRAAEATTANEAVPGFARIVALLEVVYSFVRTNASGGAPHTVMSTVVVAKARPVRSMQPQLTVLSPPLPSGQIPRPCVKTSQPIRDHLAQRT